MPQTRAVVDPFIPSDVSVSLTASTVEKSTLSVIPGALVADVDHFIFVQVTVSNGYNVPSVKSALLRAICSQGSSSSLVLYDCNSAKQISYSSSYAIEDQGNGTCLADVSSKILPQLIGVYYFAVVSSASTTLSLVSCRLVDYGRDPFDASILGLERPALLPVPCPYGEATVDLLGGNLSITIPLFEEGNELVGVPFAITYRSPRSAEPPSWPQGALGKCWRMSIEHTLTEINGKYIYVDGSGLRHDFKSASRQIPNGPSIYVDQAGTHAILHIGSNERKIIYPSGLSVEFDSSGHGTRISRRVTSQVSASFDIIYANGYPTQIKTGTKIWISIDYPTSGPILITSTKHGTWEITKSANGVAQIEEPSGAIASFTYSTFGPLLVSMPKAISNCTYRGYSAVYSRNLDGSISNAAMRRSNIDEESVSISYGIMHAECTHTLYGVSGTATKSGVDFGLDGECLAEYRIEGDDCLDVTGYSSEGDIRANMQTDCSKEIWKGVGGAFRLSYPDMQDPLLPDCGLCPGSFVFMKIKAVRISSGFVPSINATIKLLDENGNALLQNTVSYISTQWRSWFVPIPSSISAIESIEFTTNTEHFEILYDDLQIRFMPKGFVEYGYRAGTAVQPTKCSLAKVKLTNGDSVLSVDSPTTYSALRDSLLLTSLLPSNEQIILVDSNDAFVAQSISVQTGRMKLIPLYSLLSVINVCSAEKSYRRVESGDDIVGFEKVSSTVSRFGRLTASGALRSTSSTTLYSSSGTHVRTHSSTTSYADWLRPTTSSSPGVTETKTYYSSGLPNATSRSAKTIAPETEEAESALVLKLSYGSGTDLLASEQISNGTTFVGKTYGYSPAGRLASITPPGVSSAGSVAVCYQGDEIIGADYEGDGAQASARSVTSLTDLGDTSLSLTKAQPAEEFIDISVQKSIVSGNGPRIEIDAGEWALSKETIYAADGSRVERLCSQGSEIESISFDRLGRIVGKTIAGTQVYEAEYNGEGWKRDLPTSAGQPNSPISIAYDDEGRVRSLTQGNATAETAYSMFASVDGSQWGSLATTTFTGGNYGVVSENSSEGFSDDYPQGYARLQTFVVSPSRSVSITVAAQGPQGSKLKVFNDEQNTNGQYKEYMTFAANFAQGGGDKLIVPNRSKFAYPQGEVEEVYYRDAANRIIGVSDASRGVSSTYERDSLTGALIRETSQSPGFPAWKEYSYDAAGNVLAVSSSSGQNIQYLYEDGLPYLAFSGSQSFEFAFDGAGRMTKRWDELVSWSGWRITGIAGRGTLSYGADGLQTETSHGGSYVYNLSYVFGKLRRESVSGDSSILYLIYFYAPDGQVAGFYASTPLGTVPPGPYFLRRNALGDVVSIYVNNGPVAHYVYGAFGETVVLDSSGNVDTNKMSIGNVNPFRYRGMRYYRTLGVYQMGDRVYDPSTMRFMTPDYPEYLDPMARYGLSPYCYCYNDPLDYVDNTGHSPFLLALLVGIGIGAIIGAGTNFVGQLAANNGNIYAVDWLSVAGAGILGGALGIATVLGGAAGMAYAGFAVEGYSLSTGAALVISSAVVSAGNMLDYSFKTHGDVNPEGLWEAGWKGALKGAATFGLSFYSGSHGLFLKKLHSGIPSQKFFFVRQSSSWVQNTLAYSTYGELGLRAITVSLPGALARWVIDRL